MAALHRTQRRVLPAPGGVNTLESARALRFRARPPAAVRPDGRVVHHRRCRRRGLEPGPAVRSRMVAGELPRARRRRRPGAARARTAGRSRSRPRPAGPAARRCARRRCGMPARCWCRSACSADARLPVVLGSVALLVALGGVARDMRGANAAASTARRGAPRAATSRSSCSWLSACSSARPWPGICPGCDMAARWTPDEDRALRAALRGAPTGEGHRGHARPQPGRRDRPPPADRPRVPPPGLDRTGGRVTARRRRQRRAGHMGRRTSVADTRRRALAAACPGRPARGRGPVHPGGGRRHPACFADRERRGGARQAARPLRRSGAPPRRGPRRVSPQSARPDGVRPRTRSCATATPTG